MQKSFGILLAGFVDEKLNTPVYFLRSAKFLTTRGRKQSSISSSAGMVQFQSGYCKCNVPQSAGCVRQKTTQKTKNGRKSLNVDS